MMLRKTKAVRNRHLQAVMKDRLVKTSAELTYAGIAGIAAKAEVKLKPDKQRKREPEAAVIGWQRSPVSCNRAISKKLW